MKKKIKRVLSIFLFVMLVSTMLCGCSGSSKYSKNVSLDTTKEVSLIIAGSAIDFKAMETVIQKFTEMYPNCSVRYEYIQDYGDMLDKRITAEQDRVDLFMTDNIQKDSSFLPYALDLFSVSNQLDLSSTYEGLINNFVLQESEELYAIPLGGELRGLFVNKTLLNSLSLETPKNKEEMLQECKVLKDKGYIPFQSNPSSFGQQLVYPSVTHTIADAEDYETVYQRINNCDETAAEYFRNQLQLLYEITAAGYFNYKYVETEYGTFSIGTNEDCVQSFIGIVTAEDGTYKEVPESGKVAFMTGPNSLQTLLDKTIEDYHSNVEYEFIMAPTGDNGGFAYMSPAKGIAVNKNSNNLDWSLEFMNFLFSEQMNKQFADEHNIIPNTKDALKIINKKYNIPVEEIAQPQDVTFDYSFYKVITQPMISISKANNPKYMKDMGDGQMVMYDFEYYMDELKTLFKEQREGGEESAE